MNICFLLKVVVIIYIISVNVLYCSTFSRLGLECLKLSMLSSQEKSLNALRIVKSRNNKHYNLQMKIVMALLCVAVFMTSKIYSSYRHPIYIAWILFSVTIILIQIWMNLLLLSFQVMILPMLVTFLKPVETTYRKSVGTFHSEIGGNTSSTVHISQMSIPIIQNVSNCSKVRLALRMFGILKFWSI